MINDFLVTEEDFQYWRTQKLKSITGESWWTCIDAFVIQSILNAAGSMGEFWPLMVYSAALRQQRMPGKATPGNWIKVTKQLLPFEPPLRGKTKAAALDTLAKAGLAEIRRQTAKSAPEIKLSYIPKHA